MVQKDILLTALLFSFSLSAHANEWEFLPIRGDNYQPDFAIALVGGRSDFDKGTENDDTSTLGAEISLNCPLLKPPHHTIRQQISYVSTDDKGVETNSLELNPHHMFTMNDKLQIGFGPSIGYTQIKTNRGDDSAFTYGLGASLRYNFSQSLFVGGEARYAKSKDINITGLDDDIDNMRLLAKVGYAF